MPVVTRICENPSTALRPLYSSSSNWIRSPVTCSCSADGSGIGSKPAVGRGRGGHSTARHPPCGRNHSPSAEGTGTEAGEQVLHVGVHHFKARRKASCGVRLPALPLRRLRQRFPGGLQDFSGYLQTDGYSAYHKLEKATLCGCRVHLQRKFVEAFQVKSADDTSTTAETGIEYCNKIFDRETALAEKSAEERYKERLKLERKVLDAFGHGLIPYMCCPNPSWAKR